MAEEHKYPELSFKILIAFFAMSIGMFMAILDIQIVASSLSVIGAGLSASSDELSWIQTAYLISEVIVIPVSGFLVRLLSTKIAYFIASAGFTIMSICCATTSNIESMIIFRALQGFLGGAMIPITFGSMFAIFPRALHTKVGMVVGLVVTIAPTIGPTLGGYITEIFSWHFMFLINIIPGIFVSVIVLLYVNLDKPNYKLLKNFDLLGTLSIIIMLGTLQYVLEEGNKKNWFTDRSIVVLSFIVFLSFVYFIIRELTFVNPIVNLTAFKNKNFTLGCIYSFVMGIGLYGAVYLLPVFLFTIAGFNTMQIGLTMMVTGVSQFFSAPLAAKMMSSVKDKRLILAIGYITFGFGCYANSFLTSQSGYWEFFWPQIMRGTALMFCFMPMNDLVFGTMNKNQMQDASGLYNLVRNLGGAVGLAIISNLINTKTEFFAQAIKDHMPSNSQTLTQIVNSIASLFKNVQVDGVNFSKILINKLIYREAFVIAINNVFILVSGVFIISVLMLPFTEPEKTDK